MSRNEQRIARTRESKPPRRSLIRRAAIPASARQPTATEERQAELDARANAPAEWRAQFDADTPSAEDVDRATWMSAPEEDVELSRVQDEIMMMGRASGTRMVAREFFRRHGYTLDHTRLGDRIMNGHWLREQQGERLSPKKRIEAMLEIEDEAVALTMRTLREAAAKNQGTNVANLVVALAKLHDVSAKRIPGALQATKFEGKLEHSGGTDNTMSIMLGGMMDIVEERAAEQLPEAIRREVIQGELGQPAIEAGPALEPDEILAAIIPESQRVYGDRA